MSKLSHAEILNSYLDTPEWGFAEVNFKIAEQTFYYLLVPELKTLSCMSVPTFLTL